MICKFTALDEDVARESKDLLDLWREPALQGVVGPVELVKVKSHQQVWDQWLRWVVSLLRTLSAYC